MKTWPYQVKIKAGVFDVVEHSDKECSKRRTDKKFLAPRSHGFVCLYQNGIYEQWAGINFAVTKIVFTKQNKNKIERWLQRKQLPCLDYNI